MPSADDLGARLDRLVPRLADPGAVVGEVEQRAARLPARRRRGRALVAASVVALAGLAAATVWAVGARDDDVGFADSFDSVTRVLATEVPPGIELTQVDDWPIADPEWLAEQGLDPVPLHYTLAYRDPSRPDEEYQGFELEVYVETSHDLAALEDELDPTSELERLTIGDREALALWGSEGDHRYGNLWWTLGDLAIRLDWGGIDRADVLAIARSVQVAPPAAWQAAIADADVGPPYGFIEGSELVGEGDRWQALGGVYRQAPKPRSLCVVLTHRDLTEGSPVWPICAPDLFGDDLGLEHVRIGDQAFLWALVRNEVTSVRLEYPNGTVVEVDPTSDGEISAARLPQGHWAFAGTVRSDHLPDTRTFGDGRPRTGRSSTYLTPHTIPPG